MVSGNGGRAYDLNLKGSYTFFSQNEPGTSDILELEVLGSDVSFIAYGFMIRYILKIRENYFGEYVHFQTLEEFTQKQANLPPAEHKSPLDEPQEAKTEYSYTKIDNDLDILIHVYVDNGTIILPSNIYSAEHHVLLNFASFDVDLRFTNYYMDLQVNISPIKGATNACADHDKIIDFARVHQPFEPTIFIDGIIIHGNRMFGLPPTEPTYLCKWDFDLGSILINGSMDVLQRLEQIGAAAGYTYVDSENSTTVETPIVFDVTYLSVQITSVHIILKEDQTALELKTDSITIDLNDLANPRYSSRLSISVPSIAARMYEFENDSEERTLVASLTTSVMITDFVQKRHFSYMREKQQQHIALHDEPFDRCSFLLDEKHRSQHKKHAGSIIPSIPLTLIPPPVTNDTLKFIDPNMVGDDSRIDQDDDSSASSKSQYTFSSSGSHTSESSQTRHDTDQQQYTYSFNFNGTDIGGSAFLPPDSWEKFEQAASDFKEQLPSFNLNPTCYYSNDEAIRPTGEIDPSYEYDNFVVQIGDVVSFVSPNLIKGVHTLLRVSQKQDFKTVMDNIQVEVLRTLNYIRNGKPEIKNFRVAVSSINLKYGDLTGSPGDTEKILNQYKNNVSHVQLSCETVAIAFRSKKNKVPESDIGYYLTNDQMVLPPNVISVYCGLRNLSASVFRGVNDIVFPSSSHQIHHTDQHPVLLQLENPEFWLHEGETQNSSSVRMKNINLSVINEHIVWVGHFLQRNIDRVKRLREGFASFKTSPVSARQRAVYVLRSLSLASERFNIEEDPAVLTRPANIVQSSNHIRSNYSWKIIVRLRHILKSVPPDWRARQDKMLLTNTFPLVTNFADAKKDVLNVFNRWRSWEMDNMERTYVFRHAFDTTTLQETLLSTNLAVVADLEAIAIRLHQADNEDFICFDYIKFSFGWSEQTSVSSKLNVDSSLGCSSARTRLSVNTLYACDGVKKLLESWGVDSNSTSTEAVKLHSTSPTSTKSLLPLFSVSTSIIIASTSFVIDFPSVTFALETKDLEFSAYLDQTIENNFSDIGASLISKFEQAEFRISERLESFGNEVDLITFSLSDYKGSITNSGPIETSTKFLCSSADQFQLLMNKPVEYLAKVVSSSLESDYQIICPLLESLFKSNKDPQIKVQKTEGPLLNFPVIVRASCNTSEVRLNVSASWCFYFALSQTEMTASLLTLSSSFIQGILQINIADQEVGLLVTNNTMDKEESAGVKRVSSIAMPNFQTRIVLEETLDMFCTKAWIDVSSFEVRTLALSSALRLLRSNMTRREVTQVIEALESLRDKFDSVFNARKSQIDSFAKDSTLTEILAQNKATSKQNVKKPFLFNFDISVRQTIIVVPSLESSLMLEIQNFHLLSSMFERDQTTQLFFKKPFGIEFVVDDMMFILQSDTWSVSSSTILSMHLHALYSEEGETNDMKHIDIKSDHFHIMLCQRVVEKIFEIESYLEEEFLGLDIHTRPKPVSPEPTNPDTQYHWIKNLANSMTFKASFNKFCFAWLFEEDLGNPDMLTFVPARGFLFGYESLLIATNSLQGRTLLNGVYITPTFNENDIFHMQTDKANTVNTGFLPQVQLIITLSSPGNGQPLLFTLKLFGDALRISIMPSIVSIAVSASKSISNTMKSVIEILNKKQNQVATISPEPDTPKKYSLPFSFHLTVGFDGATISFWNPSDITAAPLKRRSSHSRFNVPEPESTDPVNVPKPDKDPSLWLQSPAVDAVLKYTKGKNSLRDTLNGVISISSSNNKIYPKVVPCIVEMSRLLKEVLKESTLPKSQIETAEQAEETTASSEKIIQNTTKNGVDLEEQFGNILVDVRVRLERQEIMLSCEPTARVAATVSYDYLYIGLNSTGEAMRKTSYSISAMLTNFKCSLQHIYSREVTGMASVDSIILFATKDRSSSDQQTILTAGKISDINFEVNLKQSQDLELFQDIWFPDNINDTVASSSRRPSVIIEDFGADIFKQQQGNMLMDGSIMKKYRKVATTMAIPWKFDLTIENVKGMGDLGQAVGQVTFTIDKFWLSSNKASNWEQSLFLGFDEVKLLSEGRLGGILELNKIQLSTAIMWHRHDGGMHQIPLIQATLGIESVESRISFDFHSFALISIKALHLSMFNQRDKNYILNDRLAAVGHCESIMIYATSLAASNILDLYYTLKRIRKEAHASYDAILKESAKNEAQASPSKDEKATEEFKKASLWIEKLRTYLDVNVNTFSLYIFPDTLVDLQVFTITLRGIAASYSQEIDFTKMDPNDETGTLGSKQLVSNLDMKLTELLVNLSSYKREIAKVADLPDLTIQEYVTRALEAKGGTIIGIPVCDITMQTFQNTDDMSQVRFIFSSSFGGRVDVGWNLGSVQFIRDMWENHAKTFNSRKETYEMRELRVKKPVHIPETFKENIPIDSSGLPDVNLVIPSLLDGEYDYLPIKPPIIAQPQLRDMGEATPPVEWIGLHRKKLPSLTHQYVIVSLQKLVEEVEIVYERVLHS